jgi:hypothetical protein
MVIKRGATRIVFVFKRVVIKIPNNQGYKLFLYGILANLQEKSFSRGCSRDDLAKVKFCSPLGFFLIMEKAEPIKLEELWETDWEDADEWEQFSNFLHERYKDDDMKDFMLSDSKPSNWGYINGRLVKIDYGD